MITGGLPLRVERLGEQAHGVADLAVLLSVVSVALVTRAGLADSAIVPTWRPAMAVAVSLVLAPAAVTRHPRRSAAMRFVTGGWMAAAPFLLRFAVVAPVVWVWLGVGLVLMVVSVPAVRNCAGGRLLLAGDLQSQTGCLPEQGSVLCAS